MCKIVVIILSFTMFSCAVSYKNINLAVVDYPKSDSTKRINILASHTQILGESGNKRYQTKADRNGISIVPVLIQNTSNDTIRFSKNNIDFFNNYEPVEIVCFDEYYKAIRQKTGWHMPEIIIGGGFNALLVATIVSPIFSVTPSLVGYSLILPLGIYNIIQASKSNGKMYKNLHEFDILNKPIAPGTQVYGIICLKTKDVNNLIYRIKQ